MRRSMLIVPLLLGLVAIVHPAQAQTCEICAEQHKSCMKNYAGPACKTEYQMCLKSCKK